MFAEPAFKPDCEFNFEYSRSWEKRDSQKIIKENMEGKNYLSGHEVNLIFQQANHTDDEMNINKTKPCVSVTHIEEIQQMQKELAEFTPELDEGLNNEEEKEEIKEIPNFMDDCFINISEEYRQGNIEEENSEFQPDSYLNSIIQPKGLNKKKKITTNSFEWNNFLVRRLCFRGISAFYKNKFAKINSSWQRKRINKNKKTPMHVLIKEFATQEFGPMIDKLNNKQWTSFRNILYAILFSHRFQKKDDFLEGVDFTLIRGVLYSYSTESRVELMSNPFFSLAVSNFLKNGKEEFIQSKIKNKPKLYSDELLSELEALDSESNSCIATYKFEQ